MYLQMLNKKSVTKGACVSVCVENHLLTWNARRWRAVDID